MSDGDGSGCSRREVSERRRALNLPGGRRRSAFIYCFGVWCVCVVLGAQWSVMRALIIVVLPPLPPPTPQCRHSRALKVPAARQSSLRPSTGK
jgi:hypothetical protein